MKFQIMLTHVAEMDECPQSCSVCKFAEFCDGVVAELTKRDGIQWRAAAMRKRADGCPLVKLPESE